MDVKDLTAKYTFRQLDEALAFIKITFERDEISEKLGKEVVEIALGLAMTCAARANLDPLGTLAYLVGAWGHASGSFLDAHDCDALARLMAGAIKAKDAMDKMAGMTQQDGDPGKTPLPN